MSERPDCECNLPTIVTIASHARRTLPRPSRKEFTTHCASRALPRRYCRRSALRVGPIERDAMNTENNPSCAPPYFLGNRRASSLDLIGADGKTLRQKYIIGHPQNCSVANADEMKRRGYVGIYAKNAVSVFRLPNSSLTIRVPARH